LIGIPWMVAFALRADGWYLRSDIIWHKPNPMPESVTDRPTRSHEYIFLLSKCRDYFYDANAIREPGKEWKGAAGTFARHSGKATELSVPGQRHVSHREDRSDRVPTGRNKRSVWTVSTKPYIGAHFATFPPDLIEPCILAGSKPGDTVLDPFNGSGTTGAVAIKHHRKYIGIELNPAYIELAYDRIGKSQPTLLEVSHA
jgi:DNA modification methylase